MKTIVALFLACFATALFGQAPPIQRNVATTNTDPVVRALIGTNRVQLINASGGNPRTDYTNVTPAQANSIGIGSFGTTLGPALFFANDTTTGDWLNAPWFLTGLPIQGSEGNMDTNMGQSVLMYFNGNSNGSANHASWQYGGDSGLHLINMSTNKLQSGVSLFWNVMSSSNGLPASVISSVAAGITLVPTNRNDSVMPGWWQAAMNITMSAGETNHLRGFAFTSPQIGPNSKNYSLFAVDTLQKAAWVPYWVTDKVQPQDGSFLYTWVALPDEGEVGIGLAPEQIDSLFQIRGDLIGGPNVGMRIGYNGTSVNYVDADIQNFRSSITSGETNRFSIASTGVVVSSSLFMGGGNGAFILTNNSSTTNFNVRPIATAFGSGLTIGPGGNVGINTNAPSHALVVQGQIVIPNTSTGIVDVLETGSGFGFASGDPNILKNGGQVARFGSAIFTLSSAETISGYLSVGGTPQLGQVTVTNATAALPTVFVSTVRTNANLLTFSGTTLISAIETNGFANYSTQATNELVATGYTNTTGVNMQAMVNATAVSFTVNNRAGTVIYTSPVLTGVVPVGLQPGWSIRGASGLAGTVIPGL